MSSTLIRNLTVRLGIDLDEESVSNATSGIQKFAAQANMVANRVGIGAGVALGAGLVGAISLEDGRAKMSAQLGLVGTEAKRVGEVAGKVFAGNFGDSMETVNAAVVSVVQNMDGMRTASSATLQDVTQRALTLSTLMGEDVTKVTSAVSTLLKNGLAKNAQEAFDVLQRGTEIGVNKQQDLLDTMIEYPTLFRNFGLSAAEATGLLSQGLKAGARDSDFVADALKEFSIRALDHSKNTILGFEALGLAEEEMADKIAAGGKTSAAALDLTLDRLRAVKDPVDRSRIAVQLFGTKAEDLGNALFSLDLTTAGKEMGNFAGSTDKAMKTMGETAASRLESFKRTLQTTFVETIGNKVLPLLSKLGDNLTRLGFKPEHLLIAGAAIAGIAAAIKVAHVAMIAWKGAVMIVNGVTATWTITMNLARGACIGTRIQLAALNAQILLQAVRTKAAAAGTIIWNTVTKAAGAASKIWAAGIWLVNLAMRANPIGIVITIITALVAAVVLAYKKSDTFRKIVDNAWRVIVSVVKWAWNTVILPVFKLILNYYKMLWQAAVWLWEKGIKPAWNLIARGISVTWKTVIKPVFDFMTKLLLKTIPDAFRTGVKNIGSAWNKLKEVAKVPVSFVVNTVYNKGIARMWNWVADKVGLGKLPYIQGFARGGILPGQDTGRDNQLIMARSGEGILVPEAVRGLGERFVHNTNAAANAGGASAVARMIAGDPGGLGIPGFQNGGIVGLVRSFFAKGKEYFVNGFIRAAKAALGPIVATTRGAIGGTPFGQLLVAAVEKIVNGVLNRLKPYESELGGGPGMKAVNAARSQIGVPYSWGGGGPGGPGYGFAQGANIRGFDCSSLMQYAWYKATGKVIPRTTFAQKPWLDRISSPRPGAIGQPHPGHTYMATGKGTLVEAPYTGARVREVGMRSTPYWGWPGKLFDDGGVWESGTFGYNGSGKPEYVFNDRQIRGLSSGDTYNMTFQVSPGTDVREFEDAVYRALKGYKKRNRNAEI